MSQILHVVTARRGAAHRPPAADARGAPARRGRRPPLDEPGARFGRTCGLAAAFFASLLAAAHAAGETGRWPVSEEQSVVGRAQTYVARHEDTLLDVARRFGLGIEEIKLANPGVDLWIPGEGTIVRLPLRFVLPAAARSGLVINVPEMRIYYYPKGQQIVHTWPIGIGRVGWETPLGKTRIVRKRTTPIWYPPDSIREEYAERGEFLPRVVRPGPDNPLGSHALYLGLPAYLIHGTNRPYSIGMRVSHGCIRMYPEHVARLYGMAESGTPVTLVHQRVKAGWTGKELYLEVHPNVDVPDEEARPDMTEAVKALIAASPEGKLPPGIDWRRVKEMLAIANGVPATVASRGGASVRGSSAGTSPADDRLLPTMTTSSSTS